MDRYESRHSGDRRRGGDDRKDDRDRDRRDNDQSARRREADRSEPSRSDTHRDRHRNYDNRDSNRRDDRGRSGAVSSNHRVKQEHESVSNPERTRFKREQSRSPDTKAKRHRQRNGHEEDSGQFEWGKGGDGPSKADKDETAPAEKEKPNFGLSGKLTEDTNKVNGVVIKYAEPQEARKPKRRWRLYPFKGDQALQTLFIHRQSCYLIGRDRKICDIPVDHPSCSKQHAVIQYRLVPYIKEDGTKSQRVRPYVLDLESANGTFLNNKQIDAKKFVEMLEKDVVKFGFSSREYVLLHENSKDEEQDDDIDFAAEEAPAPAEVVAASSSTKARKYVM